MKKIFSSLMALLLLGTIALAETPADTYVFVTFGAIDTLDPEGSYDTSSWSVIENVYETLYSYAGDSITEYEPTLATSYTVSDDSRVYTYTLREGVSFHSGNAFTCADVEYSMERNLVMNDPSSGIWFLAEGLLGTGSNANDDESITWELIDGSVECLDDYTVQYTTAGVDPAFFGKLIAANASIIDSQFAIAGGEWDGTEATWRDWVGVDPREGYLHTNMSGTGAYSLVEWDGATGIVAERFDAYWGEAPAIKTVLFQGVDEEDSRILALANGDADRISVSRAPLEAQVRGMDGVSVLEDPNWSSVAVSAAHLNQALIVEDNEVNVGSGQLDGNGIPADFFSDINVRKAFSYSFDSQEFIDQVFLGFGNTITMALPPAYLGYDETVPTYTYDPEKAEEFFCAAFDGTLCDVGFELTISYNTGNNTRQAIAEILAANIEDINPNFRVNIRDIQWPDFLADRRAGKLPVSLIGWIPDYADPDNYIHTFYHTDGYYGGQYGFSDASIDASVDLARTELDATIREVAYSDVANRAYELAPFILLPQSTPYMVVADNIEGVYNNPMLSHAFLWKDISK